MKPNHALLSIFVLCGLLAADVSIAVDTPKPPPDAEAAKLILGKWAFKISNEVMKGSGIREFRANGTLSTKGELTAFDEKVTLTIEATWKIENGHIVWKVTKSAPADLYVVGEEHRERLVFLTAAALKYVDEDGMDWEDTRPK